MKRTASIDKILKPYFQQASAKLRTKFVKHDSWGIKIEFTTRAGV